MGLIPLSADSGIAETEPPPASGKGDQNILKKILAGAMALGLAAMLSAAPQAGTPQTSQPPQTSAKQAGGKHTGKKHRGTQSGQNTHKSKTQNTTVKPGN